jgi:AcrR family transcriptional regulator
VADPKPTTRRERRKQEVRGRIVRAAERLFSRNGFDGTTVDQIAEAADVAQKTFFNHFPAKHDLLLLLARDRLERLYGELEETRKERASTARKLQLFFRRSAQHIEEEDRLARDVNLELRRWLSPESDRAGEEATKLHSLIGDILRDGQTAGDVRDDLEVDFLAEMVLGAFGAIIGNWSAAPSREGRAGGEPRYPIRKRLTQAAAFLGEAVAPR